MAQWQQSNNYNNNNNKYYVSVNKTVSNDVVNINEKDNMTSILVEIA